MYIKHKGDDKKILVEQAFQKNAEAAIDRECQRYKEIYGKELKAYVWMQKLNGLHCLIHPYFKHVDKSQHCSLLSSIIQERLKLFQI